METDVVTIARAWIGTPYVHQASCKHVGCDCLGLLRGVWRELYGDEPQPVPPYSEDWAETLREESLRNALALHLHEIDKRNIGSGDIAVFRMVHHAPAKHCGIIAARDGIPTVIHARQNKRVSEEPFSQIWKRKLAYAFQLRNSRLHPRPANVSSAP